MSQKYDNFLYNIVDAYCSGEINNGTHFESQKYLLSSENINSSYSDIPPRSLSCISMETDQLDSMAEEEKKPSLVFLLK